EQAPASIRHLASRGGSFLQRHASDQDLDVPPVHLFDDPPVPVPPGLDESQLRAMFDSFSIDGSAEAALTPYAGEAFWRFLRTWDLVRDNRGTALELGANPYFITVMLERFTSLSMTLANYFGPPAAATHTQLLSYLDPHGEQVEQTKLSHLFNIEEDPF